MSVNKYLPHVYVIPEDEAGEQIANGFVLHDQVKARQIQVMPCAGGWSKGVLQTFQSEYIPYLRNHAEGHVILLIDFDGQYDNRRTNFEQAVPDDLKDRVFVVGAKQTPELLRQGLGRSFEEIGLSLADDCYQDTEAVWGHDHLKHNDPDRLRLVQRVKPILFGPA